MPFLLSLSLSLSVRLSFVSLSLFLFIFSIRFRCCWFGLVGSVYVWEGVVRNFTSRAHINLEICIQLLNKKQWLLIYFVVACFRWALYCLHSTHFVRIWWLIAVCRFYFFFFHYFALFVHFCNTYCVSIWQYLSITSTYSSNQPIYVLRVRRVYSKGPNNTTTVNESGSNDNKNIYSSE